MTIVKNICLLFVLVFLFFSTLALCADDTSAYPWNGEWTLVWSDEFNETEGTPPDKARWSHDVGGGGWGNNELQFYTFGAQNAYQKDGCLVIEAREEERAGYPFTSARIRTRGKFEQAYGRYEARIKLPYGQGIWPAFWMMGSDYGTVSWPHCGEIDIMEYIGREPSTVHATVHGPGYSGGGGIHKSYTLSNGRGFAEKFHVFAIEWEPEVIRWYVDDEMVQKLTPQSLPEGTKWVFDHPFFILINLAVGGNWPGYPDDTTEFPQYMLIDYIRVYQRK